MLVELSIMEPRYHAVIETGDTTLRVIDEHGELIAVVPRSGDGEISRFKVYGSKAASRTRQD